MGLIKTFIVVVISLVITNYIHKINNIYKDTPYYSIISPFFQSKVHIMLVVIIFTMILL